MKFYGRTDLGLWADGRFGQEHVDRHAIYLAVQACGEVQHMDQTKIDRGIQQLMDASYPEIESMVPAALEILNAACVDDTVFVMNEDGLVLMTAEQSEVH